MHESEGNFFSRNIGKLASGAALTGAAVFGAPKAWEATEDFFYPETEIVGGVPAQVERHAWVSRCNAALKCATQVTSLYLGVEQCPDDIEAAKRGEQTQSFNPKVGEMNEGCNYDIIKVSPGSWQKFPDGSTIIFEGSPYEKIRSRR